MAVNRWDVLRVYFCGGSIGDFNTYTEDRWGLRPVRPLLPVIGGIVGGATAGPIGAGVGSALGAGTKTSLEHNDPGNRGEQGSDIYARNMGTAGVAGYAGGVAGSYAQGSPTWTTSGAWGGGAGGAGGISDSGDYANAVGGGYGEGTGTDYGALAGSSFDLSNYSTLENGQMVNNTTGQVMPEGWQPPAGGGVSGGAAPEVGTGISGAGAGNTGGSGGSGAPKGGNFLSNYINSMKSSPMTTLYGAGMLANLAGSYMQSQKDQENLEKYRGDTTWTPEKSAAYQKGMGDVAAGTLAGSAAVQKGTLAEQLSAGGRGGGAYGRTSLAIDENVLAQLAKVRGQALTTTSTPLGVAPGPYMSQTNPWASTATGTGGMLGNVGNNLMTMQLLNQMGFYDRRKQPAAAAEQPAA